MRKSEPPELTAFIKANPNLAQLFEDYPQLKTVWLAIKRHEADSKANDFEALKAKMLTGDAMNRAKDFLPRNSYVPWAKASFQESYAWTAVYRKLPAIWPEFEAARENALKTGEKFETTPRGAIALVERHRDPEYQAKKAAKEAEKKRKAEQKRNNELTIKTLTTENDALRQQVETLLAERTDKDKIIGGLLGDIAAMADEIHKKKPIIDPLKAGKSSLSDECSRNDQTIEALRVDNAALAGEIDNLEWANQAVREENDALCVTRVAQDEIIETQKRAIVALSDDRHEKAEQNLDLARRIELLSERLADLRALKIEKLERSPEGEVAMAKIRKMAEIDGMDDLQVVF